MNWSGAVALLVIGLFFWFTNLGLLTWNWGRDWPLILIILGLLMVFKNLWKLKKKKRKTKVNIKQILQNVESGNLSVNDAIEKIKEA